MDKRKIFCNLARQLLFLSALSEVADGGHHALDGAYQTVVAGIAAGIGIAIAA